MGAKAIIVNGGEKLSTKLNKNYQLIEEEDYGIFDAINKGIDKVQTKYFILIHSGDQFIGTVNDMVSILNLMNSTNVNFSLGSQIIPFMGKERIHSSRLWRPFFFLFGAAPPHLPTVYKTEFAAQFSYDKENKVIADYFYLKQLIYKTKNWNKHNKLIIRMGEGGNTTSGIKSFFYVSKNHFEYFGVLGGLFTLLFRAPFKFIQMIKWSKVHNIILGIKSLLFCNENFNYYPKRTLLP